MRSDRQRLLNQLATFGAFLRGETRTYSDHLTASTRSLAGQNEKKRAPRSIKNALCQSTARQTAQVQVFDNDRRIRIRVSFRGLEMEVTALAFDFQMRLCRTTRHLAAAVTALLAGAQAALLAAQARLAGPKEARVFNRVALTVGKKHFQADIQANRTAIGIRMRQIACCVRQFAHNQRVPMPIRPLDQVR